MLRRELVQKDAHVRRTCVGVHPSYTSSRSPLSRNKWCCLPSVRSRSSGSWHIACAASRQHTTWPRPSLNEYCLGAATSACTWESRCISMHNYKLIIVRRQHSQELSSFPHLQHIWVVHPKGSLVCCGLLMLKTYP